jgi:hypothetical protein
VFRPTVADIAANGRVDVRFVAGDLVGDATSVRLLTLL